jgi:putative hydrolase of the HAD superfamily
MLAALGKLRGEGYRLGALTNNWAHTGDEDRPEQNDGTRDLKEHFDIFIESSVEGLRKPDPKIYELACTRLEKRADEIVFLDDIGPNLKPARAMGMSTIKVETPEAALTELSEILGLDLVGA